MTGAPPAGIPGPTATATAPRPRRLPRRWRTLLLTVHIVVAVGALGTDAILLTLGVTGLVSGDVDLIRAVYLAWTCWSRRCCCRWRWRRWGPASCWGWAPLGAGPPPVVLTKLILTIVGATAAALLLRPPAQPGRGQRAGAAAGGAARRRDRAGRGQGDARRPSGSWFDRGRGPCGLQPWGRAWFRRR